MKKGSKELLRIQNVLESDRLNVGKGFEELFTSDLKSLIEDYFDIEKSPILKTEKTKNGYKIIIDFEAKSLKVVNFLP